MTGVGAFAHQDENKVDLQFNEKLIPDVFTDDPAKSQILTK